MPAQDLHQMAWPVSRLGELIENLARRGKLFPAAELIPRPPENLSELGDESIGRWIDIAAGSLGLEADPVQFLYAEAEAFVRGSGPAVIRLPGDLSGGQPRLLGLIKANAKKAFLLMPDLRVRRVSLESMRTALVEPLEKPIADGVERLLSESGVPQARRPRAGAAILNEELAQSRLDGGWLLRISPGSSMWKQFRNARLYQPLLGLLLIFLLQQVLFIFSWYLIGRGVFQGHFEMGWITAWGILLFATVPLQFLINDAQSQLSLGAGVIFKQRLIHGTLKLEPEEIRHQGMGQFLGRVMESEAVEMLALNGGINAILALVQLVTAGIVLSFGVGGAYILGALLIWVAITLILLWRYALRMRAWTEIYREMTNDLVERMVGHRTRLAQEDRRNWHDDEDLILDRYLKASMELDQLGIQMNALIARGWLLIGLAFIAYLFVVTPVNTSQLAVSLGGVLLASRALGMLAGGAQSIIALWIAWRQVGPIFKSAARPRDSQAIDFVFSPESGQFGQETVHNVPRMPGERDTIIAAREVSFRYRPQGRPVLERLRLEVARGERILLEGPSGGGKSTLAALLAGLRQPESGSLLLWGFDRQILGGEEWRRRVIFAPQFQENHVFADTFAFNLLMGRNWPPRPQDLEEAEQVCRELGLGELIDRMPSGLQQMVGENGWQLSHGERSRLFIARALLQNADLMILDESFGALDPENLELALRTVLQRAETVLVIAHP